MYVLESFYEVQRTRVAELMRSAIAMPAIQVIDAGILFRALELYEFERLHFAEAYLVAIAEAAGIEQIASFDKQIDRVASVRRIEP